MAEHTILTGKHIRKSYGKNPVLQDVSIHIKQGDVYGLIGKNGSGKTTLLRILTGLIPNFDGAVDLGSGGLKCKVAGVIHTPSLFLNMTAYQNLKLQSILLGQHDNKISEILKIVGLTDSSNKLVKSFSLGMLQRLKLGITLLDCPDLLVLDEPINGLDPDGIAQLRDLLCYLNQKLHITIVISSHILSELQSTATCFGILHKGRIVTEKSIQQLHEERISLEELYMNYTKGENVNA